jgi:hypothetical protein
MLYIHSGSAIEQSISEKLNIFTNVEEFNSNLIQSNNVSKDQFNLSKNKHSTLLYSFQDLNYYKHLDTFQLECKRVDELVESLKDSTIDQIILLSYPGAYFNSDNLFIQHKGVIEQKFSNTGKQCVTLKVQAIYDEQNSINSLHVLFFDNNETHYLIPKNSSTRLYSISVSNLVDCILSSVKLNHSTFFDVFDQVTNLENFLIKNSRHIPIVKVYPMYLYFKSLIGQYCSPNMLELFLRSIVPMYNYRTEKELDIDLHTYFDEEQFKLIYPSIPNSPSIYTMAS